MTISLGTLLVQETKSAIYSTMLGVATAIGLPVSSWQPGDPTRALFFAEAELLEALEAIVVGYIQSGFLDYAEGDWLEVLAEQVYGVIVPSATAATATVVLTNNGGGYYPGLDPGDVIFKSTISGKTYTNVTGGTLASGPGTSLIVTVVADELGSDSSAGVGEIDDLVTGLLGVTVANTTSAVGIDKQDEATTRQQCRDKLGALSPNGPKEAYAYVARNAALSGTSAVTRVRVYGDSSNGHVTVYLAGPAGGVSETDRALVEAAILKYATPITITPTVLASVNVVVPVTYELWLYKSANVTSSQAAEMIESALEQLFAARPIGGDIISPATTGKLYRSLVESTIRGVFPQAFRVEVALPVGDTALSNGEVAALGVVTATVNQVVDP